MHQLTEPIRESDTASAWPATNLHYTPISPDIAIAGVQPATPMYSASYTADDQSLELQIAFSQSRARLGRLTLQIHADAIADPEQPVTARLIALQSLEALSLPDSFQLAEMDGDGIVRFVLPGILVEGLTLSLDNVVPQSPPNAFQLTVEQLTYNADTRIMLLGDSITNGVGSSDGIGYRKSLYQTLINNKYTIDFVGSAGTPPYEGHFSGGRKIADFYPISVGNGGTGAMDVTYHMSTYRPNIVTILLGTNDILGEYYPAAPYIEGDRFQLTASGQMATLVSYLLKWSNGEKGDFLQAIIVSLDIPVRSHESYCLAFNADVSRMIRDFRGGAITGRTEPVYECDHYSRFMEDPFLWASDSRGLMDDGYHPSDRGHALIAANYTQTFDNWFKGRPRWFSDLSWQTEIAGIDVHAGSQGIAISDYNDDGWPDIYISRIASLSPDERELSYINQAGSFFIEDAKNRQIDDPGQSRGLLWVDIDNDGDWDLFNAQTSGPNRLYRNTGAGQFTDITATAGIVDLGSVTTTTVLAFDIENDGDMDLYAANSRVPNELYVNQGNVVFSRENRGADDVVETGVPTLSAAAADFNQDGFTDIYLVKREGANRLYVNQGDGTFVDRAAAAGVDLKLQSNGAVWADMDNDGDLDLLVSQTSLTGDPVHLRIYRNEGDGTFTDLSALIQIPFDGYSVLAADFDNDGWVDILATDEHDAGKFYHNDSNWKFSHWADSGAEVNGGDVRGAAVVDIDRDGDVDVVVVRADAFNILLLNNLDNNNHFLQIEVDGPAGNRGGFGTRIWVYRSGELGNPAALLGYREVVSASGHQSQSSAVQHYGLGTHSACDVMARFSDGTIVIERQVAADQLLFLQPGAPGQGSGEPAVLLMQSGNGQSATVGNLLPDPIAVQVRDVKNNPVQGARVDFTLQSGSAQILAPTSSGESIGFQTESSTLGGSSLWAYDRSCSGNGMVMVLYESPSSGTVEANIDLASAGGYYVWMRALHMGRSGLVLLQVDDGAALTVPIESAGQWNWYRVHSSNTPHLFQLAAGRRRFRLTLPAAVCVDRVLLSQDPNYLPVGIGDEDANPLLTDSFGVASRAVRMGNTAGPVQISAQLYRNGLPLNGQTQQFDLVAQPGEPISFAVSGDRQIGEIGVPLAEPFAVDVFDVFNNHVPAVPVTFELVSGGGTLQPSGMILTNDRGHAETVLTPGEAGSLQQVRATIAGLPGSPYLFTATVRGVASSLHKISGDGQSDAVSVLLAEPLRVRVMVADNEPAPSYPVTFRIVSGGGSLQSNFVAVQPEYQTQAIASDTSLTLISDSEGYVQIYWRLGTKAGTQQVVAQAPGLTGSPIEFLANALPDRASRIFAFSGNEQSAPIMENLPEPFVVRVVDVYNNPIANHLVSFTSLTAGGIFTATGTSNQQVRTDSLGYARSQYRLGTMIGTDTYHVQAIAVYLSTPLSGSPVDFYASGIPGVASLAYKLWTEGPIDTVGTTLSEPLRVKITDSQQNPVSGYPVLFQVVNGGGKVDEQNSVSKTTDSQGIARAIFRLGPTAGMLNHTVEARIPNLTPSVLQFTASACAGSPYRLEEISGNKQVGSVNSTLLRPFVVRISDFYGNATANHQAIFQVISQEGTFSGSRMVDAFSNELGLASAHLTLGSQVGDSLYWAEVRSYYRGAELQQSPIRFVASGLFAQPVRLVSITDGSLMLGAAFQELKTPLRVKVVDAENKGVAGIPVNYTVISGNGSLLPDQQTQIQCITDGEGLAEARWILGSSTEEQKVQAAVLFNGSHLQNSPFTFSAIAVATQPARLLQVSGDLQTGIVGQLLEHDLVVKVVDMLGLPVSDHPVRFQVIQGDAVFQSTSAPSAVYYTSKEGEAGARLILGTVAGHQIHRIRVTSIDTQGQDLDGSPQVFVCSALPAAPDWQNSQLTATSPIPANGVAYAALNVRIADSYDNPIADRLLKFSASPDFLQIDPEQGKTDSSGSLYARAVCTVPGVYTVRCQDLESGAWISASGQIEFISSPAARIVRISGQDQIGYLYSQLAQPLQVLITDIQNRPVAGFPVHFSGDSSRVSFLTSLPVVSDDQGIATTWILCRDLLGSAIITAQAPGLTGHPVLFDVQVKEPQSFQVVALTPSPIVGLAAQDSLVDVQVQCVDDQNRPIGSQKLYFTVELAQMATVDSLFHRTRYDGKTTASLRFGNQSGQTQLRIADSEGKVKLTFDIVVKPSTAGKIQADSGDQQQGIVGKQLARSLVVRVADTFGNAVQGVRVTFAVAEGDGHLIGDSVKDTDSDGRAAIEYQLGTRSGEQVIEATTDLLPGEKAVFRCQALPDQPWILIHAGGQQQTGIAKHLLSQKIAVRVNDRYSNGVPGTPVFFRSNESDDRLLPSEIAITDSTGVARVAWILGSRPGLQSLAAVRDGLQNSPLQFIAVVLPNNPPTISAPDSVRVRETEPLVIEIELLDQEQDPIVLQAADLPTGAHFDSTVITWVPDYGQAGFYDVWLTAVDSTGATSRKNISIKVERGNRKPKIIEELTMPTERNLGTVKQLGNVEFRVAAFDPDGDPLAIVWTVNDQIAGSSTSFYFQGQLYPPGDIQVQALVFDPYDTTRVTWSFQLITPVDLETFCGESVPFNGIQLTWKVRAGKQPRGFFVLRAAQENGTYERISGLIPSNTTGDYRFFDDTIVDEPLQVWHYRLQDVQFSGEIGEHAAIAVSPVVPTEFCLYPNHPNPFNPETSIRFQLSESAPVRLTIIDLMGRHVATLVDGPFAAGFYRRSWNGSTDAGDPAASGIYFAMLISGQKRASQKLILLR
ncbi:MAG TPA: FG-GAP-like repeat-containing protein [bacterium]|nr:FG-GAP-like repeat-containing protein [bacterium]HPG44190.1 FG-GAP-like repeat-containing protein [bacterium]HPM96557.1 FG-GAP-like repeat-containing protein [bacterium]